MRPNNPDGHQELPRRKPYSFVQLPETALERGAPIGHDRYSKARRTGRVEGVLKVLSPLHVASGMIETQTGRYPLVKAHFRSAGRPTIPGSSLKGAIRSIVEAISNPPSCIRVTRARTYNVPKNLSPCSQKEMLCIACRMFGANGYEGQVLFRDARLIDGETEILAIPPLFAPRSQEWAYYDGNTVKGRKFYRHGRADGIPATGNTPIEVCPKGAAFEVRIDFVNLSDAELGLLLIALGQGKTPLYPKLGGGKPACCGTVRFELGTITVLGDSSLTFDPEPVGELPPFQEIREHVHPKRLKDLAEILKFPGDDPCPGDQY